MIFNKNNRTLKFGDTAVNLPTFMPVGTKASVKGLTMDQVRSTGVGIVLGNTYHLHLTSGEELIESHGGLANFTHWNGPMLTDSGGFQVFSLSGINKITEEGVTFKNPSNGDTILLTPEKSIQIQHAIGADIIMAFDDVINLSGKQDRTEEEAMERTHRWLERCIIEHNKLKAESGREVALFGIFQGGLNKKLRQKSLEFINSTEVDGVAVGGLSVGEARDDMHQMLEFLAPMYDQGRPVYLMGVGHPVDLRFAFAHGIDMADCVLPTRNGRHGTYWAFDKDKSIDAQINLKNEQFAKSLEVLEPGCDCQVCTAGYTRSYLRHLVRSGESLGGSLLGLHNIRYLQRIAEFFHKKI